MRSINTDFVAALLLGVILVAASTESASQSQAQVEYDYDVGNGCKARTFATRPPAPVRALWQGLCQSGYAQGPGTMVIETVQQVSISRGEFRNGYREGAWQGYSRLINAGVNLTGYQNHFQGGNRVANSPANSRELTPSELPAWAEVLARGDFQTAAFQGGSISAQEASQPASPRAGGPKTAPVQAQQSRETAPQAAPRFTYKSSLYIFRFDLRYGGSYFMSIAAPDEATARQVVDRYLSPDNKRSTYNLHGSNVSVEECSGRQVGGQGGGEYFALVVVGQPRKTQKYFAASCGASTPSSAARHAITMCRQEPRCNPSPNDYVYLLASSHAASGRATLFEYGRFGNDVMNTPLWNNYDFYGCIWSGGKLAAEGGSAGSGAPGNPASTIRGDCRSYF